MRIALAQLNPIVGDIHGNTQLVLEAIRTARQAKAELLITSELMLIGYPPRDLLMRHGVAEAWEAALHQIAEAAGELAVIIGHPRNDLTIGRLRNSASLLRDGRIEWTYDKRLLPGYDVFDEDRYFAPGSEPGLIEVNGIRLGVLICEDLWRAHDVDLLRRYDANPLHDVLARGCDLLLSLNASPFVLGKWARHLKQLGETARTAQLPILVVNQAGANDDLIFDGRSVAIDAQGNVRAVLAGWRSDMQVIETDALRSPSRDGEVMAAAQLHLYPEPCEELFHALVLAIRDYVRKTGHREVVLGLSGGIDSAVVAVLAAAALGPEQVIGVLMPSRYSSAGSIDDADALVAALGLKQRYLFPIEQAHTAIHAIAEQHAPLVAACEIADENVQARLRGILLMALSNTNGSLVLSTSNKSESAVGYTTLYGDMCGAIAPIADVLKTQVYDLARWINAHASNLGFQSPPIPQASIDKPPSAELRPNQTDQDTLPPYAMLDRIIRRRIDGEQSPEEIAADTGIEHVLIVQVLGMIDRAQFKRDQASVTPKVSPRAFGPGRPMPIVMKETRLAGACEPMPGERGKNLQESPLHE